MTSTTCLGGKGMRGASHEVTCDAGERKGRRGPDEKLEAETLTFGGRFPDDESNFCVCAL